MPKPPRTETREADAPARSRRDSALSRAVALLSRREHSAIELKRKLVERGFPEDEVDSALSRLQANGLQDDARYAAALVRAKSGAGQGPLRLRAELARQGVDPAIGSAALEQAQAETDWHEGAMELLSRRFKSGLADVRDQRRATDLLLRRGFPGDVVQAAVRRLREQGDAADNDSGDGPDRSW